MLKIVGDISLTDGYFDVGFGIGSKLRKGFDPFRYLESKPSDCWIGNFEGVASETSTLSGDAAKQFRIEPSALSHLHHFDLYGLANNHVMQHGSQAYDRTIEVLSALGARCFGSNEVKTQLFEHQERTVSVTGFSQRVDAFSSSPRYWHNPECAEIEREVASLPNNAYKIAFIHWGNEFIPYPSSPQKKFAHWLVDAGFDLIVGMHPHVLQGYELYNGKYIFYSLGNFVLDMPWSPTKYGAVLSVDLIKGSVDVEYAKIDKDYAPKIVEKRDVPEESTFEHLNQLLCRESNTELYHTEIEKYYKAYRRENHRFIARKMMEHPGIAYGLTRDFVRRKFFKHNKNKDRVKRD